LPSQLHSLKAKHPWICRHCDPPTHAHNCLKSNAQPEYPFRVAAIVDPATPDQRHK